MYESHKEHILIVHNKTDTHRTSIHLSKALVDAFVASNALRCIMDLTVTYTHYYLYKMLRHTSTQSVHIPKCQHKQ